MLKTSKQILKGWGTVLDYQNKTPSVYVGKSFFEAWHDDIDKFNKLTNEQKWEMGYWVERQAYKNAGIVGFCFGVAVCILTMLLVLNFVT